MERETVVFKSITYYRYPKAARRSDRVYFKRQGKYLHRAIWEDAHGPIPAGCFIHHRNSDPLDNSLDNLALVASSEHLSHHKGERVYDLEHLARIRPLAARWHSSKEGRQWHAEHGRRVMAGLELLPKNCAQCGRNFMAKGRRTTDRFCSSACKTSARRATGKDSELRSCPVCGAIYVSNKYARARTCSRKCGAVLRAQARRASTRL